MKKKKPTVILKNIQINKTQTKTRSQKANKQNKSYAINRISSRKHFFV